MCIAICHSISCVQYCNHHHNQETELFHHKDLPHATSAQSHPPHNLPASLVPGSHESVLHLCNFAISRMLYKQNHILFDLLTLAFLTQHIALEIHSSCWMHQQFIIYLFIFIYEQYSMVWLSHSLTIHLLGDILVVNRLLTITNEAAMNNSI